LSNTCGRIDWGIPGPSSTISTHAHTPSFAFSRDTKTCTGTPDGERDEIDRLQLQVVETAVGASGVEQRRHERRELTHGVLDGTHLHDVVTAALGRGATCERVQAPRDRLQVIANVVRDDTDELLGHAAPRLLHGRPADRLDELRALGDARDPVRGAGDERRVERREEVGSPRRDEHHASPPPSWHSSADSGCVLVPTATSESRDGSKMNASTLSAARTSASASAACVSAALRSVAGISSRRWSVSR
jgi:hypothetical protein